MSPAPQDSSSKNAVDGYTAAWAELIQRVTEGHSWSGRERNNCYLNTGSGRFAGISTISGLDFKDDGRALGLVDWDHDGDLDLWFRNRSAPRLRLLLNQTPADPAHAFVALKLQSTIGNRDAIGAVVEVVPERSEPAPQAARYVKSVRAGDLFLSQSSTWLHFGLGQSRAIAEVRVLWPGGKRERFAGIEPGKRYLLKEGAGKGILADQGTKRTAPVLPALEQTASLPAEPTGAARILLPARVPLFPSFAYLDAAGARQTLGSAPRGRLLVLWSESCAYCQSELLLLTKSADALRAAGLDVLALSVDGLHVDGKVENTQPAYELMDRLGFPFAWGFVEAVALDRLHLLEAALFDRRRPASVPLSLLLDPANHLLAIYRGPPDIEMLLADAKDLLNATDETLHHLAPLLAGRWFTRPVSRAYVAENLARSFQKDFPEDAAAYLHLAATQASGEKQETLIRELAARYHVLARRYRDQEQGDEAAFFFEKALRFAPASSAIHHDYGILLASYGNLDEAEQHFRRALQLDPGSDSSRQALEMIAKIRAENRR